ncbi:MAG: FGGY-family carbohydrate kinase [bacterium]
MDYCIGIDAGTTNLKVILFDLDGNIISSASSPTPVLVEGRFSYFLPDRIWEIIKGLIKKVALEVDGKVASIAVTSVAESMVPIGENGEVLFPAIAWYDERTVEQMEWLLERIDPQTIYSITGLRMQPIYGINKILWMKKYQEDVYRRAKIWLPVSDFIAYMLSGETATDYSQASRIMAFDLNKMEWSREILEKAEIPIEILPKPMPSGTVLGKVKNPSELGLKPGTIVAVGGHDHVCGAFINGCFRKNIGLDSMGTAESFQISTDKPPLDLEVRERADITVGAHVARNKYYMHVAIPFSGGLIEWTAKLMQALGDSERGVGKNLFDEFSALAEKAPVGSNGLFCVPHFLGSTVPKRDPQSRGIFLGLKRDHTPMDEARSVLEGLSFEARLAFNTLEEFEPINKIIGIGGGSKNLTWLKIKSTVIDKVIEVPQVTEGTAMGAAFLGALGAGLFKNEEEIVDRTYKVKMSVEPDKKLSPIYRELFEKIYVNIFYATQKLDHIIDEEFRKL